jgi:hypothetical protein
MTVGANHAEWLKDCFISANTEGWVDACDQAVASEAWERLNRDRLATALDAARTVDTLG